MAGDFLKRVAADRMAGERPSVPRALATAGAAGVIAAVIVYRLLRGGSS